MADEVEWPLTAIDSKEDLYRRVPEDRMDWLPGNVPRFSARIFRDRYQRPSVYRRTLCDGPRTIQASPSDGVLVITAAQVRGESPIKRALNSGEVEPYDVNVMHVPEGPPSTTDYAHSEIFLDPATSHDKTCNRLYEALALLAKDAWAIKPARLR